MTSQMIWWAGLVASVCGALLSENAVAEPYHRYLTVAFIVSTAISGYMVRRPEAK